jgi:hypothetical protein
MSKWHCKHNSPSLPGIVFTPALYLIMSLLYQIGMSRTELDGFGAILSGKISRRYGAIVAQWRVTLENYESFAFNAVR